MDSFTMQKDLHPLFAPFCNLQSAHTISRRLWREVRISTSVARSQATARTKREISDSSRASTPEKICLHQFFNLLQLLAGDLPLKRSLKGIYDLQSKDLPMLRKDFHVCPLLVERHVAQARAEVVGALHRALEQLLVEAL